MKWLVLGRVSSCRNPAKSGVGAWQGSLVHQFMSNVHPMQAWKKKRDIKRWHKFNKPYLVIMYAACVRNNFPNSTINKCNEFCQCWRSVMNLMTIFIQNDFGFNYALWKNTFLLIKKEISFEVILEYFQWKSAYIHLFFPPEFIQPL